MHWLELFASNAGEAMDRDSDVRPVHCSNGTHPFLLRAAVRSSPSLREVAVIAAGQDLVAGLDRGTKADRNGSKPRVQASID